MRSIGACCGDRLVVGDGVGDLVPARAVVDLDQQLQLRADGRRTRATRSPSDEWKMIASASALSRRYHELVVEVAVVDVDRHAADLEHAELRLQVLVAVVQVEADLRVRPEAGGRQRAGEARGSLVVLAPRPADVEPCDDGGDARAARRRSLPRRWRSASPSPGMIARWTRSATRRRGGPSSWPPGRSPRRSSPKLPRRRGRACLPTSPWTARTRSARHRRPSSARSSRPRESCSTSVVAAGGPPWRSCPRRLASWAWTRAPTCCASWSGRPAGGA